MICPDLPTLYIASEGEWLERKTESRKMKGITFASLNITILQILE